MNNSPLHSDDVERVISRYRERIEEFGVGFESMKSGNLDRQRIRHWVHSEAIRAVQAKTVLDIGCGIGFFLDYLREYEHHVQYTGYDILPEYVDYCTRTFPQSHFAVRNIFEHGIDGRYDTIVLSQVLNNRYHDSDNYSVMARALELCFAHCDGVVSIDMMSSYVDFQNPDLFYYDPSEVFRIAKGIARRVVIRHDYRPFEYTLQLFADTAPGYVQ
jgi:SAM-dependent methyltransferase